MFLKVLRTSVTNDEVRMHFVKLLQETAYRLNYQAKYLKTKGWIANPPLYPYIPKNADKLDCGEAFHLWDHLTYRYDNIRQTTIYYAFANDGDFKILLEQGIKKVLLQQASMLEKEMKHYGIPLPIHPPNILPSAESSELLEDEFMYKTLLAGMQGAAIMHATAVKQCLTNDRIRGIFIQLLNQELEVLNNVVKYGKVKGWFNPIPYYKDLK